MRLFALIMVCTCAAVLSACAQHQHQSTAMISNQKAIQHVEIQRWWESFNDPLMNTLAEDLMHQNLDVQIAKTRVREARAFAKSVDSGFFPDVTATASAVRGNNQVGVSQAFSIAQGGFDTTWEIDVFGQTAAQANAAKQGLSSSQARLDNVMNTVIAELMRSIVNLRLVQQSAIEIENTLKNQDTHIALLNSRVKAGLSDNTLLKRALAERAQTATQLSNNNAALDAAIYQIEQLMGQAPHTLQEHIFNTNTPINPPEPKSTLSISIDSMQERPDIRAARSDMLAAQYDLVKAELDVWPRITLKNFFGIQEGSNGLPVAANPTWSLTSGIMMPLLNFGRLRSAIDAANARSQGAMLAYEKTILAALSETHTALSDYLNGMHAVRDEEIAMRHRQESVALATKRYQKGFSDMTDLTTAQAELNRNALQLLTRKAEAALAYIRLQKALDFSRRGNEYT